MDNEKVVILPNEEEMLKNLLEIDDNSHLQERFYPLLTRQAGQEKVAEGVVLMLSLAISDYTQGMPSMLSSLMYMKLPNFIDALVDDPEVAQQAKDLFKEINQ